MSSPVCLTLLAALCCLFLSPATSLAEEEVEEEIISSEPQKKVEKEGKKGPKKEKKPSFDRYVRPLKVEAGPLLSPAIGAVPRTELWAGAGFLFGREEIGRTEYHYLGTRLVLGGEWSPVRLERFGMGAALVAFQTTHLRTEQPAVDEWSHHFDLGPLRLLAHFMALGLKRGVMELALTPFFRLVLPTDTSRVREERHMPIRAVLDDRVVNAPYFLIEPGVSVGLTLGPMSFYTHQAPILAPVHDEAFHFIWSMHYGMAVSIGGFLDIAFEIAGLLRPTQAHQEDPDRDRSNRAEPYLTAFALCPGVRLRRSVFDYEVAARIGISEDAYNAYGDFTLAFAMTWVPGRK